MDLMSGAGVELTGRSASVGRSRDGAGGQRVPEALPMSDLATERSEALRKIHAQSSAETSGLGDSLQRIHTLSSTETSGYGDTVPSPTAPPSPSPDANPGRGICSVGQDHVQAPAAGRMTEPHNPGHEARPSRTANPGHGYPPKIPTGADGTPEFVSLAKGKTKAVRTRKYARHASPPPPQISTKLPVYRSTVTSSAGTHGIVTSATDADVIERPTYGPLTYDDHVHGAARSAHAPRRTGSRRPKLQRSKDLDEGIDDVIVPYSPTETPPLARVDSRTSRRHQHHQHQQQQQQRPTSVTDSGAANSGAGRPITQQSTWLKWSEDRRTSFKRRLDSLEQRQRDHERTRVSTPVRKARKESVMFVSPQLEDSHVSIGESYPAPAVPTLAARGSTDKPATGSGQRAADGGAAVANHVVATAPRKPRRQEHDVKADVRLSEYQMNALSAFWEHDVFVRSRWTGIVLSLVSFMFGLISATNYNWSTYTYPYGYVEVYGLWQNCSSNVSSSDTGDLICSILPWSGFHSGIWDLCHYNITRLPTSSRTAPDSCSEKKPYWQNAVIGLLIFSVAFGFLATVLSICGVCTTQLAKKIYYFHSAGEIYLICALATAAGLVVYPVAIEVKDDLSEHSFGVGYGLGWVAAMFFLASALCMCLDDLVRAFARGMCKCCRRESGGDTRV